MDKEKRITQIANRYTPPLDLDAVRARFTTRPVPAGDDRALHRGFMLATGDGTPYERLEHGQIYHRGLTRPALSRKHRLRLRRPGRN